MFASSATDDKDFGIIQDRHPATEFIESFLVNFDVAGFPGQQCIDSHIILVLEVSFSGEEHGDAELVAFLDGVLVADRAAGLDDGGDSVLGS